MKKTKFLKKTAFPAAPEYADGFLPPAGFDFKMSVSLRGKDIKIYGFDGTQWEMIHNTDGIIDDFIGNVLHQKYYFESKTGVEQVVRVSFLSQEEEPELELDFGTSHESRKFHHIEEVPAYRGGDEGKFLTIRTDGSLAWLGLNESYVVEVIGTGGESQTPAPSLLSQSVPASNLATYNAETDVMTFNGSSTSYATFAGEYSFPDAITIATWFKTTATGMRTIMSSQVLNSSLGAANGWRMILDNGRLKYRHPSSNSFLLNGPAGLNNGEWQHAAITWTPSGYTLYVNGVESATGAAGEAVGTDPNFDLHIGAIASTTTSNRTNVFSGQIGGAIVENEAMTAEQIQAIYNNGPEYVASTEAPAVTYPIVGSLEDDTVNFSTYYTGTITEEGTFKHGSHSSSMFRSVAQSDDYKIMEDTTITMWVKTPHFTGEKSLIKFGGWSGSSAKGVDILFDSRTTTARHATGQSIMSSWTDGHLIVEVATDTHSASTDWAYRTYFKMPNIRDNEWHQIVVEFSNVGTGVGLAKGRVFVDGVKVVESFRDSNNVQQDENGYQELSRNPGDIVAGDKWISCVGFPTNSEFDGITIEKYLLTDEQIIAKYNAGR